MMARHRLMEGFWVLMVLGGVLGGQLEKIAFAQLAEPGKNLATNPSFEDAQEKSPLPAGWNGTPGAFQRDVMVTKSGKASLKYVNTDPKQYLLCSQKVPLVAGYKYRFGAWVKTQDIRGAKSESGATICLEWQGKDGKHLGGAYPSGIKGTKDWTRIEELTRLPEGAASCNVRCYVRPGMAGTAWFDDVEIIRVVDPPMQSVVESPLYRGRITPAGPKELRVRVLWNLADHDLKPQEIRVHADLLGQGNKIVRTAAVPLPEGRPESTDLTVPATGLEPGRYDLAIRLEGPGGKELQTEHHAIECLPSDVKATCAIDEHRRLLVEGKPFFPIGMYFHGMKPEDLELFARSKFNCLMSYAEPNRKQMDLAQKHHLKVIYTLKDLYAPTGPWPIRTTADEEPVVRNRVREFRDHPALLAWYLNDEFSQKYMPQLEAHQRWVTEEDPNHPTWVVLYQYQEVAAYLKTFDVIGTDPYPIPSRPVSSAGQWTAETFRQTGHSRPMWQVPQVFNWANYGKTDTDKQRNRTPTLDEIRSMAWQCIAEGATGLVFYSWMDLKRNPDAPFDSHWEGLKRIAAEVDQWASILLSIEPAPALAVEHERPRWLHWLVRKSGDKLYLFVVNDGDGEGTASFTLPSVPKSVRALGEDRPAAVKETLLSVELPRLAVRCYEIELAHP